MGIGTGLASQARQLVGGFLLLMQNLSRLTTAELRANAGALRAPLLMLLAATGLPWRWWLACWRWHRWLARWRPA
jgi:hypothetical protein